MRRELIGWEFASLISGFKGEGDGASDSFPSSLKKNHRIPTFSMMRIGCWLCVHRGGFIVFRAWLNECEVEINGCELNDSFDVSALGQVYKLWSDGDAFSQIKWIGLSIADEGSANTMK